MFKTVTIPPKGRVNFHANLFVKGMVIPIIVILLSVMIVFIFSYSRTLSSHNLQMKRVQLGVMCSHLAVGCANVVAQLMDKETSSIYQELTENHTSKFAYIIEKRLQPGEKAQIPVPDSDFSKYETMLKEMVESTELQGQSFKFEGLNVFFEDIGRIITYEQGSQFSYQDMLEKQGFLTIEVGVSTVHGKKLTKIARVKRPFKVVNLLPPIHSRFTLFVANSPDSEIYNQVQFDPSGGIIKPRPLELKNSPVLSQYSSPPTFPADQLELQANGWVYIGNTNDSPNDNVYLNMAEGYSGKYGQMFLFGKDPGNAIIRYTSSDSPGLRHWLSSADRMLVMLFQKFEGFTTPKLSQYNADNLLGRVVPPLVSWIQPFGNATALSRTLIVGPVFGRVLKIFEMGPSGWKPKDSDNIEKIDDPKDATLYAWGHKYPISGKPLVPSDPVPSGIGELYKRAHAAEKDTSEAPKVMGDIFSDAGKYYNYSSHEVYVPFNQFFDLVRHPVPPALALPSWFYVSIPMDLATIAGDDGFLGFLTEVSQPPAGCIYMARPDVFTFGYSMGAGKDFFKFSGDLSRFKTIDLAPLLYDGRATKKIYLKGPTAAAELASFKAMLLGGGQILDSPGIIKIYRDPSVLNPEPLFLPTNMANANNTVLIFDRGDVVIDGITCTGSDKHLTLVLFEGSFRITSKKIQAYLVAVKPPTPGNSKVGKLISHDGKSLNVEGGIAVQELGIPSASSGNWASYFQDGGEIQYNLTFNPCHYWINDYYSLFLADSSPFVEVIEQ